MKSLRTLKTLTRRPRQNLEVEQEGIPMMMVKEEEEEEEEEEQEEVVAHLAMNHLTKKMAMTLLCPLDLHTMAQSTTAPS